MCERTTNRLSDPCDFDREGTNLTVMDHYEILTYVVVNAAM